MITLITLLLLSHSPSFYESDYPWQFMFIDWFIKRKFSLNFYVVWCHRLQDDADEVMKRLSSTFSAETNKREDEERMSVIKPITYLPPSINHPTGWNILKKKWRRGKVSQRTKRSCQSKMNLQTYSIVIFSFTKVMKQRLKRCTKYQTI